MAIVVKHGGGLGLGALAGFGEGAAKRAMESARFTAPKQQGGHSRSGGNRGRLPKEEELKDVRKPFAVHDALLEKNANRPAQEHKYSGWGPGVAMQKLADAGDGAGVAALQQSLTAPSEQVTQEYSPKQRQEYNALSDAYDEAVESGDYTEDELAEIKHRMDAKRMGIKPLDRMEKPSPFPQGQGIGDAWDSEDGSQTMTRNKDGDVKISPKPGFVSPADKMKAAVDKGKVVAGIVQNFTDVATGETNWEQVNRVLKMAGLDVVEESAEAESKPKGVSSVINSAREFVDKLLDTKGKGVITSSSGASATFDGQNVGYSKGAKPEAKSTAQGTDARSKFDDLWESAK